MDGLPEGFVIDDPAMVVTPEAEGAPAPSIPPEGTGLPEGFVLDEPVAEEAPANSAAPSQTPEAPAPAPAAPTMGSIAGPDGSLIDVPLMAPTQEPGYQDFGTGSIQKIPEVAPENVADLPSPSEEMFSSIPREQQEALRAAYAKHPKSTRDDQGNIVYNGQKVPNMAAPVPGVEDFLEGPKGVAESIPTVGKAALKGTANFGSNVIETLAAGGDMMNKGLMGVESTAAEDFRKAVPKLEADKVPGKSKSSALPSLEQFLIDTTEIAEGAAIGGGIGRAVGTFFDLGKLAKAGATLYGGSVGEGIGQDAANPTMFTGDEAALKNILPALGTDKSGTYSENIIRKRFDLINDAVATNLTLGGLGQTGKKVGGWIWNKTIGDLVNFASLETRQKNLTLELLDLAAGIDPEKGMSADQIAKARRIALEKMKDNATFRAESGNADLGNIEANRTVARTAEVSGTGPEGRAQLEDFEGAIRNQSKGPMAQADAQLGDELAAGMDRFSANEAGPRQANVESARQTVTEEAENLANQARRPAEEAEGAARASQDELEQRIANDPIFGGRVQKILNDGSATTELGRRGELEDITVDALSAKRAAEDAELKRLTDEIPLGLRQNNPHEIRQSIDELGEDLPESVWMPMRKAWIEDGAFSGFDYKELADTMMPLSKEINRQIKLGANPDLVNKLMKLRDRINSGAPDAIEVQARKDYYENTWATHWKDGLMDDFADLEKGTRLRPVDRGAGSREIVQKALDEPDQTKHVRDILDTPTGPRGNEAHLVDQVMMNDVIDNIANHVIEGKPLSEISPNQLTAGIKDRIGQIRKTNPDIIPQIDQLFDDIKTGRKKIETLQEEAKVARNAAQDREVEIFGQEFKDFYEDGGKGKVYKPKEGANQIFEGLITQGESNQLSRVVKHINESGNPEAKKGMRGSYMRVIKDKLFRKGARDKGSTPAGRDAVNPTEMAKFDQDSPLYKAGEVIYADEPQALEFLRQVADEISQTKAAAERSGRGLAEEAAGKKTRGQRAVNTMIAWSLGVLNPTATKAKTISGALIDSGDPANKLARFAEEIMSDSTKFNEMAEKYMKGERRTLSPEAKLYLRRAMYRAGVVDVSGEDATFGPMQDAAEAGEYQSEESAPEVEHPHLPEAPLEATPWLQ